MMQTPPTCKDGEGKLIAFLRRFGGPCLSDIQEDYLVPYLRMRAADKCLKLVLFAGHIVGYLDAKQCHFEDMENHWGRDDATGDCLVFANYVIHPEFGHEVRQNLAHQMKVRWPNWESLHLWMFREKFGGLVQVEHSFINRTTKELFHGQKES